uniref:Gamma-secretase subunit APH-1 n=1 Tax=Aquila chrysaetos chrysaetos TaxID=223781 RepID=A0A663FE33_AQUCH
MTLAIFFGCTFIAFGPVFSLFLFTIARDPLRIIILIAGSVPHRYRCGRGTGATVDTGVGVEGTLVLVSVQVWHQYWCWYQHGRDRNVTGASRSATGGLVLALLWA